MKGPFVYNSTTQKWEEPKGEAGTSMEVTTLPTTSVSAKALTVSGNGDNTVHTPAAGKKIRLYYASLNADDANSAAVIAILKFGAGGAALYKYSLGAGGIWARNISAGRRHIDGAVDQALILNLSAAQSVHVSIEYEEV